MDSDHSPFRGNGARMRVVLACTQLDQFLQPAVLPRHFVDIRRDDVNVHSAQNFETSGSNRLLKIFYPHRTFNHNSANPHTLAHRLTC